MRNSGRGPVRHCRSRREPLKAQEPYINLKVTPDKMRCPGGVLPCDPSQKFIKFIRHWDHHLQNELQCGNGMNWRFQMSRHSQRPLPFHSTIPPASKASLASKFPKGSRKTEEITSTHKQDAKKSRIQKHCWKNNKCNIYICICTNDYYNWPLNHQLQQPRLSGSSDRSCFSAASSQTLDTFEDLIAGVTMRS